MWRRRNTYNRSALPVLLLALTSYMIAPETCAQSGTDSLLNKQPLSFLPIPSINSLEVINLAGEDSEPVLHSSMHTGESYLHIYDSLRSKASRFILTKKLYDLLIVSPQQAPSVRITETSRYPFEAWSGKTISDIKIQRLSVFGTNINNPKTFNPTRAEVFLNKTHISTNELIIRNNLLFRVGDTVSPLTMSDNERLLRELPFIDESRIVIIPVSDDSVEVVVITRDVYSLGADFNYKSIDRGTLSLFDKNLFGLGHELVLDLSYNNSLPDSPGFGIEYNMNNIRRTFINANIFFFKGLGRETYGVSLQRNLVSSETKYAGGLSIRRMITTEDLDTLEVPEPVKYNFQDYWLSRSFLLNRESVTRLIIGARYTNNNVFEHPFILPDSYYNLQKYRIFMGSLSFSMQKYHKASMIFGYGRTEDIPFGGLITITAGREINETGKRTYTGIYASTGHSIRRLGYFYTSAGFSTFYSSLGTEQGLLLLRTNYLSNLLYLGRSRLRNFLMADYTRGFDRFSDEYLIFKNENSFSGFSNDSIGGTQRLSLNIESVLFSPLNVYGFRFAFFAFGGLGYLFGTNEFVYQGDILSSIGLGVRIRNDNLVFRTFQIRLGYFPSLPHYSMANYVTVSGEQLLKPQNFDPGPPAVIPFR
mgnify:CR=1 FL=1